MPSGGKLRSVRRGEREIGDSTSPSLGKNTMDHAPRSFPPGTVQYSTCHVHAPDVTTAKNAILPYSAGNCYVTSP